MRVSFKFFLKLFIFLSCFVSYITISQEQEADSDLWIDPDELNSILSDDAQKQATLEDIVYGNAWRCKTDPPGNEVGVTTHMRISPDDNFPVIIRETNFIQNEPKPVEIDMDYAASVTKSDTGQLTFKSLISSMGEVRNWPEGVSMNPPESVELKLTTTSQSTMSGWTRSYGITSTIDCWIDKP